MNERDEFGTGGSATSPGARGTETTPSGPGDERRFAGEQAGPAAWSDRVPGSGSLEDEGGPRGGGETGRPGVARKAAHEASRLAHEATQGVEQAVGRRKDEAADRIAGIANAVREAARTLQQQDSGGLARYADTAAQQLERASGYLRERDVRGVLREVEGLARRRPELFLAGSVLAGLALARFLKSSSRRPHDSGGYGSPYAAEGSYADEGPVLESGSYAPGSYEPEGSYRREGSYEGSPSPSPSRGMGEV